MARLPRARNHLTGHDDHIDLTANPLTGNPAHRAAAARSLRPPARDHHALQPRTEAAQLPARLSRLRDGEGRRDPALRAAVPAVSGTRAPERIRWGRRVRAARPSSRAP